MQRLKRIAARRRRTAPDLYRLMLEDFATEEERKLGLAPANDSHQTIIIEEDIAPYGKKTGDTERLKKKGKQPA